MRRRLYDESPASLDTRKRLLASVLKRAGVTTQDIAERIECHPQTVQKILRKPQAATADLINIITTMAKITPEEQAQIFFPDAYAFFSGEGHYRKYRSANE